MDNWQSGQQRVVGRGFGEPSPSKPDAGSVLHHVPIEKGWYVTTSPIITANWRATGGNVWTVPFGAGVGRVMKLGFQR